MNLTNPDLSWRYVCFYFQVSLLETGWKMTNMPFRSQRFAKDWGIAKQLLPMASLETAVALTLTIGSQKFLITIDFIDSARNINFDLKIDISRSKSRNLNFCDIGANIEISILKYRNLNFEISESQF